MGDETVDLDFFIFIFWSALIVIGEGWWGEAGSFL